ncbi:16S rRNA (cytosine(967)-C(5))-methyltransferase RsmB [Methylotenera versatilis]|uniref:16S rRNA (cytosine(967)-C(5))-methyltransferase RsmB n=1 Tax=Methylotenera versatilis TaxID=1055487 RepID=UPI000645A9BA|nr:16S rRNA (cytosine(967)-C(5))-methyltransferase RsmB [Methylotenera versatilis]
MYISQQIAAIAISQVLSGRNLTLALPDALSSYPNATPQQRGAAADLSYGTLRFYGEVNAYLVKLLEKPLSNEHITALLLVAIYQLLHDKADDFTVVNQAVEAASYAKPRWAKGLVNGVLRNFLRQKIVLSQQVQADTKNNEVALYSYPQWWINKLKKQYPSTWQNILTTGNAHPPMTLRVNVQKTSAKEYVQLLARQDIVASQVGKYAVILEQPIPVEKIPGFADGVVSVQDYGAQLAAGLLDLKSGMTVLDACCAPGGKTGHILELADIKLTALDNDASRLNRVESNLNRLNLNADLQLGDAAQWQADQPFERILADVPCTASGIVRRHVDIKWLRRESDIASFCAQQSLILANLWQLLAKGGKLLYVTCSIFNEENQQQIDNFLLKNHDATQLPLTLNNENHQNIQLEQGQLIPNHQHDGLFYALLQKT